jgi:hypothetical protein
MNLEDQARKLRLAERIDGAAVLHDIHRFIGRFVAYPSEEAQVAHTLWIAHTHLMEKWDSTPRLAALSPEKECGKSRVLEVTESLVPRPVQSINVTPAYLFRKVGDPEGRPTILYDEVDTIFGPRARENEEIRGLLNAGHRRHSTAGRCVVSGRKVTTEEIPAYCAVALAGIGNLPDTITGRSIILPMRRRSPSERVEPWRSRIHSREGQTIQNQLTQWANTVEEEIPEGYENFPEGVEDRAADMWEPLLLIADQAGADWPDLAREACVAIVTQSKDSTPSLGVRLLRDTREVFGGNDHMSTIDLLNGLYDMEEAPWAEMQGRPLDPRGLARLLRPYEIKPTTVRVGNATAKGYSRADLWDAWQRYLSNKHIE